MSLRSVEPCVWCGNDVMLPGSSWRTTDDGQIACSDKCETEWSTASSPASVHALLARVALLEALAQPATEGDEYRRGYAAGVMDSAKVVDKDETWGGEHGHLLCAIRALAASPPPDTERKP